MQRGRGRFGLNGWGHMQPEDDADDEFDYPVHAVVSAAATVKPTSSAPTSIFDVAAIISGAQTLLKPGRFGDKAGLTVQREPGVTRVQGAAYPSNRWTEEKEEKERTRRENQKYVCPPPKPSRKAVTTNGKIRRFEEPE